MPIIVFTLITFGIWVSALIELKFKGYKNILTEDITSILLYSMLISFGICLVIYQGAWFK